MERVKGCQDFGTSNFTQAIIESVLSNDLYSEVLNGLRKHYKRKMKVLQDSLDVYGLRDLGWDWEIPKGGLLCWIKGSVDINTNIDSSFCKSCMDHGVLYVPGSICFADDEPTYYVRLSIGSLDDEHLQEAVKEGASAVVRCLPCQKVLSLFTAVVWTQPSLCTTLSPEGSVSRLWELIMDSATSKNWLLRKKFVRSWMWSLVQEIFPG